MKYPVSGKKHQQLQARMNALGIRESDFKESFVRSQGPGGQNVNKVATCVMLKHRPTGLTVKCQKDRSQAMNRYYARRLLVQKLDERQHGLQSEELRRIRKIRNQRRKRSRRAKEKLLEAKRRASGIKQLRGKILPSEFE